MDDIRWHRVTDPVERDSGGHWRAQHGATILAYATNTSATGSDNYPWDWWLTPDGRERAARQGKTVGVEATLRDVKSRVAHIFVDA